MKLKIAYRVLIFACILLFSGAAMALVNKTTVDDGTITTVNVTAIEANIDEVSGHAVTGNIDMNGNRITDLAEPVEDQDIATKNYVDTVLGS